MLNARRAALAAAVLVTACGGGGGGGEAPVPTPPIAITPSEALRLSAQAVMDLTELAWALSSDVQNTVVTAPSATAASVDCAQGGRAVTTRPTQDLVRIEYQACRLIDTTFGGQVETDGAVVTVDADGTGWSGTVRFAQFSTIGNSLAYTVSAAATGAGFIDNVFTSPASGQPMSMQVSGLTATRTPDALGRGATLSSALLRVERIPGETGVLRDLYALEGCVNFSAAGLAAELCIDAGSRIALLENVGPEQLAGRLRWNAGTPAGFDTRLRLSPAGAAGSTNLRVELDLDNNGSFETAATLDRSTDIGLRL
jgi:hypothetical protein